MHRVLESSRESRLPLAAKAGKLIDQLSNRHVQIGVDRPAVNIPTRQGEPCARRKAGGEATMTAQYDFGRERVIGETCDRRKFLARELTQRVRKGQVMSGNVDGQISHGEQQLFEVRKSGFSAGKPREPDRARTAGPFNRSAGLVLCFRCRLALGEVEFLPLSGRGRLTI